jgi:hypothetical protein
LAVISIDRFVALCTFFISLIKLWDNIICCIVACSCSKPFDILRTLRLYMNMNWPVYYKYLFYLKGIWLWKLTVLFFSPIWKITENCRVTSLIDFCFLASFWRYFILYDMQRTNFYVTHMHVLALKAVYL